MSALQFDHLPTKHTGGSWEGVEGADAAFYHCGALLPVNLRLGLVDFVRIGDTFFSLRYWAEAATGCHFKPLHNQTPTQVRQLVVQTGRGVIGSNQLLFYQQHVARVQPGIHLHEGDTRLNIACFYGSVNRCCAAPSWQQ